MRRAVCPGSFDPVTNGHLDIVGRAAALFDEVVVAVGVNKSKSSNRMFTPEERMDMLRRACEPWPNVSVRGFTGLLTDFCAEHGLGADVEVIPASQINEAYERMLRSDVKYRFSIDMSTLPQAA